MVLRQLHLLPYFSPLILKSFTFVILPLLIFCCCCCLVSQSCPTLCNPMDYSPPGSSVHGILQARTLEWVAIPSSRGSSWPRDQTQVSLTAGRFFTLWATREAQEYWSGYRLSLLQEIFPNQESNHRVSWIAGRFFTMWAMKSIIFLNLVHTQEQYFVIFYV